jgi:hypothetical protein
LTHIGDLPFPEDNLLQIDAQKPNRAFKIDDCRYRQVERRSNISRNGTKVDKSVLAFSLLPTQQLQITTNASSNEAPHANFVHDE